MTADIKNFGGHSAKHADEILQILLRSGEISVDELVVKLKISASTVRRALNALEKQGLLYRTHGGAGLVEKSLYEPFRHVSSFREQEQKSTEEKRRIGLAAAECVADGDIIAVGAGTTTTHLARSLRHRKNITVVTNAVNIAMELSHRRDLKVIVTGGELSGDWFALVGSAAVAGIGEFYVDKAFIGVDGVDAEHGLTTDYPEQAAIHRAILRQARQKIIVADCRKAGARGKALICPISGADVLITDTGTPFGSIAELEAAGVIVRRV